VSVPTTFLFPSLSATRKLETHAVPLAATPVTAASVVEDGISVEAASLA